MRIFDQEKTVYSWVYHIYTKRHFTCLLNFSRKVYEDNV